MFVIRAICHSVVILEHGASAGNGAKWTGVTAAIETMSLSILEIQEAEIGTITAETANEAEAWCMTGVSEALQVTKHRVANPLQKMERNHLVA